MTKKMMSEECLNSLNALTTYLLEDEIHYISKANSIAFVKKTFHLSERDMADQLPISKSEVHRMLQIAELPKEIKEKAVLEKIEKWCIVRLSQASGLIYKELYHGIMTGQVKTHHETKLAIKKIHKIYN